MGLERKPIVLGVDYGTVRVGIAVSDALGLTAQPVGVFPAADKEGLLRQIEKVVSEREIRTVVVGLPLNMDGSEGPAAAGTREFGTMLGERLGVEVILRDERLSTVRAERTMLERDLSRKKRAQRRDTIAAQLILQSYLDSQGR